MRVFSVVGVSMYFYICVCMHVIFCMYFHVCIPMYVSVCILQSRIEGGKEWQ